MRTIIALPKFVKSVRAVVGTQEINVDRVSALAVTGAESPAHTFILRIARIRVLGIIVDCLAQYAIERRCAEFGAIILQPHAVERHIEDVGIEWHRRPAQMCPEILIARRYVERNLRIAETRVVVGVINSERERKPVDANVHIGKKAIAQRRGIARPD